MGILMPGKTLEDKSPCKEKQDHFAKIKSSINQEDVAPLNFNASNLQSHKIYTYHKNGKNSKELHKSTIISGIGTIKMT